jgi:hypothetical protein
MHLLSTMLLFWAGICAASLVAAALTVVKIPTSGRRSATPATSACCCGTARSFSPAPMTRTEPAAAIRVAIADDHVLVRAAIKRFISSFGEKHFVGQAGNAEEILDLLLDVNTPGHSVSELPFGLRVVAPRTRVAVVSALLAEASGDRALSAGTYANLERPLDPQQLVRTIRDPADVPFSASNDDDFTAR